VTGCRIAGHSGEKIDWNVEISDELPGSENGTGALAGLAVGSSQLTAKSFDCVFDEPACSELIGSEALVDGMPSD